MGHSFASRLVGASPFPYLFFVHFIASGPYPYYLFFDPTPPLVGRSVAMLSILALEWNGIPVGA